MLARPLFGALDVGEAQPSPERVHPPAVRLRDARRRSSRSRRAAVSSSPARDSERSIAFLEAFLLSEGPQRALVVSQEGGHHPRFGAPALANLVVQDEWTDRRELASQEVEAAIRMARTAETTLRRLSDRALP